MSPIAQIHPLLGQLEPWLRRLPAMLVDVLEEALRKPHKFASAEDLAATAGVTLTSLYRSFRNAGMNSPKRFVVGAHVFRGYIYLKDPGFSIADVAIKLRYTHPRIFARHIECVIGECPSKLRHSLDDSMVVSRLVAWLCSAERPAIRLSMRYTLNESSPRSPPPTTSNSTMRIDVGASAVNTPPPPRRNLSDLLRPAERL